MVCSPRPTTALLRRIAKTERRLQLSAVPGAFLGALPFTLIVPYADLFWTGVLTIVINLIMSSAFAAILIYALELLPGRVGLVSGFFYGVTFGLAGIAAALLGALADQVGIETVYKICSFLPAMGLLAWFLPRPNTAADA